METAIEKNEFVELFYDKWVRAGGRRCHGEGEGRVHPPCCLARPSQPPSPPSTPRYVNKLLQVIVLDKSINQTEGTRVVPASILGLLVDLFCFFVQHHSYRIKYYLLRSHMIEKVNLLQCCSRSRP